MLALCIAFQAAANICWPEMKPVTVTTKAGPETIVAASPLLLVCMDLSSRLFSLAVVGFSIGLLLIERAKMISRVEVLEEQHRELRGFLGR